MRPVEDIILEIRQGDYTELPNGMPLIQNTFAQDFRIAEVFGDKAIQDTFRRAFKEWKSDIRYLTALYIVVNHLSWDWYGKDDKRANLYIEFQGRINDFIFTQKDGKLKNVTQAEQDYFTRASD